MSNNVSDELMRQFEHKFSAIYNEETRHRAFANWTEANDHRQEARRMFLCGFLHAVYLCGQSLPLEDDSEGEKS